MGNSLSAASATFSEKLGIRPGVGFYTGFAVSGMMGGDPIAGGLQGAWTSAYGMLFNGCLTNFATILVCLRVGAKVGIQAFKKYGPKFISKKVASKGTTEIVKGAVSKGARIEARNLAEQLTLNEAKAGAGKRIMQGKIKDPNFPADTWKKMQHVHNTSEGQNITIHYWQRIKDGFATGFKFKD